jgi:hypothetical protein
VPLLLLHGSCARARAHRRDGTPRSAQTFARARAPQLPLTRRAPRRYTSGPGEGPWGKEERNTARGAHNESWRVGDAFSFSFSFSFGPTHMRNVNGRHRRPTFRDKKKGGRGEGRRRLTINRDKRRSSPTAGCYDWCVGGGCVCVREKEMESQKCVCVYCTASRRGPRSPRSLSLRARGVEGSDGV